MLDPGYVTKVLDPGYVTKVLDPGYVTKVLDPGYVTKVLDPGYVTKVLDPGYVTKATFGILNSVFFILQNTTNNGLKREMVIFLRNGPNHMCTIVRILVKKKKKNRNMRLNM